MNRIPEPEQTPEGPAYEGRLLSRPSEEVVDQGAGFDIKTLVTRRRVLSLVGVGVGAAALAACGSDSTESSTSDPTTGSAATSTASDGEIPQETNGPYPADGTNDVNILEESGIVRSDITSSLDGGTTVDGVPLTLTFMVTDMANGNVPFEDAAVYVWHCDAAGLYSMYSEGVEDETYLRGIQVADSNGELTFQTIVPGCYAGRWTHIHFEVYPDVESATNVSNAIATSQLAFPADMLSEVYALDAYAGSTENLAGVGTSIEDDAIFADGGDSLQTLTVSGDAGSGYTGTLAVAIDTTTEVSSGDMGGGPQGGQPPGDGGAPPSGDPPRGGPGDSGASPS
ncbi:intradiol ring-cleavage dioxygenase [Blastococcus sp. Marseille-P5729]|uniref:intradiol ring-cleavage dioxygenase n=1 Tax=Blastococcus sp. Marseille-P5729 TaxID=2086582 RepID=UPI000D10872A|nr:intradiol ring-cleavage dioxygenase [Blastococcus sp. Marseille-P5729]